MTYKTYTRAMLSSFTGRPAASFPATFVEKSAIPQALLLFKLGTCLASPDHLDANDQQLVDFAIMSMADSIHLAQPYQAALASPFNSESIGSYSYSKTVRAVRGGEPTGVTWFDMAIEALSVCDSNSGDFQRGGIEVYEHDGGLTSGAISGNVTYLTPVEVQDSVRFGFDPSQLVIS